MSATLQCPNCAAICIERGDESKGDAHGEYRVYDSDDTFEASRRVLECLVCKHFTPADQWQG